MVQWSDSFWGEGYRGFDTLSSNIKNGAIAIEEFQRFLTESAQCESTCYKNLSRLQSQFLKSQHVGTFTPVWNLMRDLLDKISVTHLTTTNFYQDLLRDIHNYQELYHKKVKLDIQKDGDINRITDLITQLNNSLNTVNKAKEQYYSIAFYYERAKRGGNNLSTPSSVSTSQDNNSPGLAQSTINSIMSRPIERLERKYRQAQEDYKLTIEKYNLIRNDYEKRFSNASAKFQAFEIDHIEKMLAFSLNYSEILQRNSGQIRTAQNEFNDKLKLLTGNEILDAFVEQRKTGGDRPAVLQFEEVDHLKTSIPDLQSGQDDLNLFNSLESGVPSFQAHFSIPSPSAKQTDNNRALTTHSPSSDPPISPSGITSTPSTSMANTSLNRSQDGNSGNEQTSNPFDPKTKRPKFPALFRTKRTNNKGKTPDKKKLANTKSGNISQKLRSRDASHGNNSQSYTHKSDDLPPMTDGNGDNIPISSNNNNKKPLKTEPSAQSSPSISDDDNNRHNNRHRSPSSSSSGTSDDDDDNLMTKISVVINEPKTQVLSHEDDDAKIMNAMHLIGKNIGNFVTNSRGLSNKTSDMNKSISSEQIGTRILPPPPPIASRSATAIPNNVTVDNVDYSSMFPPHDEFAQLPFNALNINLNNQKSLSIPSESRSGSKNTTSISSNDDDREVANSFPNNNWINKTTSFPILQVPSAFRSNRQAIISPISPSIASMNQSFNSSPTIPNEIETSPLTIGAMDQIPLAIAFQETIHVMISGDNQENWKSRIVGQMLISFPSSMLNLLIDPSRAVNTLEFRLKNIDNIENIVTKPSLIIQNESSADSDELIYSFDMTELNNILRNLQEKNPSSLFFNLNVLNYELKQLTIPIEISSQWARSFDTISVNIKYHFNSSSLSDSIHFNNNNTVIFYTIITDGQQIKESSPNAEWTANEHKVCWKVPYINNGTGDLSATVMTVQTDTGENDEPLTTSSIVKAYFVGEDALFSSIDFDLICRGYRISLLKKKILSGKYQSEPDQSEPINFFKRPTKSSSSDT